jgi:hypothetical protein
MREALLERYLHLAVEKAGGTTRKFNSPGRRHVPDRIVIWPPVTPGHPAYGHARVEFVEMKAPGKKARPGQEREHVRLQKLGCVVVVLDTQDKIDAYVRRHG